jgi:hypothetical protein
LDAADTLNEIRAAARESEARHALTLESALADMRADVTAALQANEDLVVKTLQAFSQFLAQPEPEIKQPASKPSSRSAAAFLPPKP